MPRDWIAPATGWPEWLWSVRYDGAVVPGGTDGEPSGAANCQTYAYAVLRLFGVEVPPHRSSDLWADAGYDDPALGALRPLDLVLFSSTRDAYGAHVAVFMARDQLLHLCAEIGFPIVWSWPDFRERERYRRVVGAVRVGTAR